MAKANHPHWKILAESQARVVFSEPHAYISPRYYTRESVPTWNYIAVHFLGTIEWIDTEEAVINLMEKSIRTFEPKYLDK